MRGVYVMYIYIMSVAKANACSRECERVEGLTGLFCVGWGGWEGV